MLIARPTIFSSIDPHKDLTVRAGRRILCAVVFVIRTYFRFCVRWRGLLVLPLLGVFVLPATAKPYGIAIRPMAGPFLNGVLPEVAPSISGNWSAVSAFPQLLFTNSVGLTPVPGTDQLCVWEREGR